MGVVSDEYQKTPTKTFKKKEKPPFGLTIFKVCVFEIHVGKLIFSNVLHIIKIGPKRISDFKKICSVFYSIRNFSGFSKMV